MSSLHDITTETEFDHEQLAELAASTPCDKGCACIRSNFQEAGRVECAAKGQVLFCLEENKGECRYWRPFGQGGLCTCPVRLHVAKHSK